MNESDHASSAPSSLAIALAFAVVFYSWGTTYLATSIAMKEEHVPPALFGGIRLVVAGCILFVWQFGRGHSMRLTAGEALRLFVIGIFLFPGGNFLINIGQQKVSSGVSAILIATTPLWMGLFGMLWPAEPRLSWRGWLGLSFGFLGVVATLLEHLDAGFAVIEDYHHLCVLASAACWAIGSLLSRHVGLKLAHLTSASYQMIFGGLCQTILGTCLGEWQEFALPPNPRVAGAFTYLVIFGSLAGFVAFNWLLGHIPAAKVGTYAYVNPLIALGIGWCYGDTAIHLTLLAGVAIILGGVYLVRGDHRPYRVVELEPD